MSLQPRRIIGFPSMTGALASQAAARQPGLCSDPINQPPVTLILGTHRRPSDTCHTGIAIDRWLLQLLMMVSHAPFAFRKDKAGDISVNLSAVRARITATATAAGRDPAAVTLVAVSKTQSAARVTAALGAGQRVFGENRVQEAAAKWPALK